jgi:phage-related protein
MSKTDAPLEFVGTSREDLSEFPDEVKYCIGFALRTAQKGGKHPDAKPLKGFKDAGVLEIVSDPKRAFRHRKPKSRRSSAD